jgi:hypothetical protein
MFVSAALKTMRLLLKLRLMRAGNVSYVSCAHQEYRILWRLEGRRHLRWWMVEVTYLDSVLVRQRLQSLSYSLDVQKLLRVLSRRGIQPTAFVIQMRSQH